MKVGICYRICFTVSQQRERERERERMKHEFLSNYFSTCILDPVSTFEEWNLPIYFINYQKVFI